MTTSIVMQGVNHWFGDGEARRQAIFDVSLEVTRGSLTVLAGPSGCGKTTLLRIIAGLEAPDSGSIHFAGQDTTGVHVRERGVGFVFQHYALFKHMTVFDNVAFGLRMKPKKERPSEAQIRARVLELLSLVQLDWVAERFPAQLSGGQRQRIALARALAVQPQVLLLDEPFGALDAKVRKELRRWLRRLHDELHVTSIFVTHDQEEALEVADRVVVINQGQIEQVGTPQEVWDNPASPFVYGFLGDVNLFQGRAHDGSVKFATGLELASTEAQGANDAQAWAYIRPHELDVSRPAAGVTRVAGGLLAQLDRAIVVGPVARLELIAQQAPEVAHNHASEKLIEAHISAHEFHTLGLREGETLLVTPRRAKVFVDQGAGI